MKKRDKDTGRKFYKLDLPRSEIKEFESIISNSIKNGAKVEFEEIGGRVLAYFINHELRTKLSKPFNEDRYGVSFQEILNNILG